MIPITVVRFGEEEEREVLEVLRSGTIAQGPKVAELERRFADYVGAEHAVAVNNGTTALIAAIEVLDLEPGDEVLTSPFTFAATLNAILAAGATATFADVSLEDFNVTAPSLEASITDRTRVLMPVHLYGQIADMHGIAALADARGLRVVEDTAQSHGSRQGDVGAGTTGIGTFSFYATKNITTGEGGIVTTNDADVADRLRVLRNQGMRARYQYEMAGNNYRLTDLQAAVALPQLDRYPSVVAQRDANARRLSEILADVDGIEVPRVAHGRTHVWHQYTVRVTDAAVSRDELVEALAAEGIGAGVYYPRLVFDYDVYRGRDDVRIVDVPNAERLVREVVSLPVHQHLSADDVERVGERVAAIARGVR